MAVIINASTSAGAVTTADTSGVLQLQTGGTAALTVDASQNVGIGTSSPGAKLVVTGAAAGAYGAIIYNTSATGQGLTVRGGSTSSQDAFNVQTYDGGASLLSVQAGGNVGIGTSSPDYKFNVGSTDNVPSLTGAGITLFSNSLTSNVGGVLNFRPGLGKTVSDIFNLSICAYDHSGDTNADGLSINGADGVSFSTGGNSRNERARIDSSGNLLVGTTDSGKGALTVGKAAPNSAYGQICALSPTAGDSNISGMSVVKYANDSTTAQVLIRFLMNQGGTGQGQINANGANTAAFGSYSDSRLKENIVDLPSQLDNIMALRPVEYDYIESMGGGHQIGFVAQEVQAIYPDLVAENEDGMLTLTDMNKNDARLIKCIQEQQTLITALTARITALEGAAA